jgi:hypothetical protein
VPRAEDDRRAAAAAAEARLRDAGVRTPDFVVIGNGRAVVADTWRFMV